MVVSLESIVNDILDGQSSTRTNYRRDILRVLSQWHNPLTAERIFQLLEMQGSPIKMDTLYDILETLSDEKKDYKILKKTIMPSNQKRGRPPNTFTLRKEIIDGLLKLTEDLVDGTGFGKLVPIGDPAKMAVVKATIERGKLTFIPVLATEEDFEKTWKLDHHIQRLQSYCNTDSQIYKEYDILKSIASRPASHGKSPTKTQVRNWLKKEGSLEAWQKKAKEFGFDHVL